MPSDKRFKINKFEFSTAVIPKDSILFAFNFNDLNNKNKVIGRLSVNGRFGELIEIIADSHPLGNSKGPNRLTSFRDKLFYHAANLGRDSLIYINTMSSDGAIIRTNRIRSIGKDLQVNDISYHPQNRRIGLLGSTSSNDSYFLAVLDTLNRVITSNTYTDTVAKVKQILPKRIVNSIDKGYIVSGRYYQINTANVSDSFFGSFVAKHDSLGRLIWTKYVDISAGFPVVIDDVSESVGGNIVVVGTYTDSLTGNVVPFSLGLSSFGVLTYSKKYPRVEGIREFPGGILKLEDGASYYSSITKTKKQAEPILNFIRMDVNGGARCEDPITNQIVFDLPMKKDTIILTSGIALDVTTKKIKVTSKSNAYDVPILTLESKTFCPNQPIMITLRATTKGAVSYEWATGEKTDTLLVTKEGEYSVIVTINTNECYTFCDTSMITVYEKPIVELLQEDGNFCTNGLMRVRANIKPSAPIRSIVWSTGARNTDRIEIASGPVSITITDTCGQVATASINVVPLRLINQVSIAQDFGSYCTTRTGKLTANADASVSGYTWGNNRFTQAIEISAPGTYSVTIFDICRNQKIATTTVVDNNIPKVVNSVSIQQDISDVCKDDMVGLRAIVNGQAKAINWSNGTNGENIKVANNFGNITVTATDDCGNKTSSTQIDQIDPVCIKMPKIFFPESNNTTDSTTNRTFRAMPVGCPTSGISNFEFRIFNRWGKEIFATTTITESWDGNISGEKAPPDVYVYFIRYRQNDCTLDRKGEVTLYR
jgi:gliding motility-associated-like protein